MDTGTVVLCHILVEHGALVTCGGCRHCYTVHNETGLQDQRAELCRLSKVMSTNDGDDSETIYVLLEKKEEKNNVS